MVPDPLSQPLGVLMRPVVALGREHSLARAASALRDHEATAIAVVESGLLLGVVSEASLAQALGRGASPEAPLSEALDVDVPTVSPHATGAEALRMLGAAHLPQLFVVDEDGRPLGTVSASDLYPKAVTQPVPQLIGGMATPFGVYLTNGSFGAGVGHLALVSTGALLFGMYLVGALAAHFLALAIYRTGQHSAAEVVRNVVTPVFFMAALRFLPLSKIHAAEHKVVHAMEQGEPLAPEVVERMSRVHPRCGTNLAVGATLFLSISTWELIPHQEIRLLLAILVTLFCWRPLGSLMQRFVTTSPPKERHIESGIKAGKELLEKYRTHRKLPSIPLRIWHSGMLHVIAGSTLAYFAAYWILRLAGMDVEL